MTDSTLPKWGTNDERPVLEVIDEWHENSGKIADWMGWKVRGYRGASVTFDTSPESTGFTDITLAVEDCIRLIATIDLATLALHD